ncbi:FMN-binding protein [Candidatus Xianfuyuplasma coldseepsis]|uniref:FMN-binding protein n=1 Tax=Candidatus Xianfuyuplasma coldseepsis TaxID=2782163 RepID=A0A7L7KNI4_9MOLU|nr:FMN-binding protein [Xianfuyuplasma coldseepsis]QMS84291.1 FMN-binding protein [Xianfuyuplasma coldseepsis]
MKKTAYFAIYLAVLGMIVTLIAYLGYNYTQPIIIANTNKKISDNIALLFDPEEGYKKNDDQADNKYRQDSSEYSSITDIYEVLDQDDELFALIYDMNIQGRNDVIYGLVAVDPFTETIIGVTYYDHAETPNLGEKYTRDEEIEKLVGQSIADVDVDQLAGATTTWNALETMYDKLYEHYNKEVNINE